MVRRAGLILILVSVAGIAPAYAATGSSTVEDHFTVAEIARADDYRGTRYVLGLSSLGLSLGVAGLLGLGVGSRTLGRWSVGPTGSRWKRRTLLLAAIVTLVPTVVALPLSAAAHGHDRRFGLATNSLSDHLLDVARGTGLQLFLAMLAAVVFVAVARRFPRRWPFAAAAAGAALTVALVYLFPVVYEPVFNRFDPADPATRARVLSIADRAGVDVREVLVADASRRTTRKNAYVSGIGSTRRVVLYDTLVEGLPPEQLDVVVAHELAHERNADVRNGTVIGAAGVILAVAVLAFILRRERFRRWIGIEGAGDPAVVPFLAFYLAAASFISLPLANGISRSVEARADREAIRITNADAAIDLQVALARDNLSDLTPNRFLVWMFFSHPPVLERIDIAMEEGETVR